MTPLATDTTDYRDAVIRVSRRNGREGDSFLSPDIQREMIQRDADQHGYVIRQWHDETDSVSGKTTNRAGLKAAMDACLSGESNGITVAKVDRFSRNLPEGLTAIRKLHDAGKHFVAVQEGVRGTSSRGSAKALLTLLLMFAEWQLESVTDGWGATRESCVERGVATHAPYGYVKDEATRRLKPVPAEAKVVRRIFTMRKAGKSLSTIAEWLTDKGIPNPSGGPRWTHSTVSHILERRVYLGELSNGVLVNPNAHKRIVDRVLFDAARERAATTAHRRNGKETAALLTGLMRCGSCGGGMRERNNTVKGVTYRHYRCRETFGWGRCPKPANCVAADIEAMVLDQFAADFLGDAVAPDDVYDNTMLDVARDELIEAQADLEHFVVANASLARKRPAVYRKGLEACLALVDDCEAAVRALSQQERGARLPRNIVSLWPDMDTETRREHLSASYGAVVVWPGEFRVRSLEGRVHIFRPDEIDGLPGRGGEDNAITPIPWPLDD